MNKPELHIKSLKEPIYVTDNEADLIEKLMADGAKDHNYRVVIEGVWSGRKGDIRFVKWPKSEEGSVKKKIVPMTAMDAAAFESRILPYKMEAEASGFGTYRWKLFYMQAMGAIDLEYLVTRTGEHIQEVVLDIFLYPKLQDEISSYEAYLSKKKYAEEKQLEGYEEMAEQLSEVTT